LNSLKSFIFLLLLVSSQLYSQEYKFKYITKSKGLESLFVTAVSQDSTGKLYIGTDGGLGIYDGQKMRFLTKMDSLIDNYISAMLIDKDGNVWLGHEQGGSSIIYEDGVGQAHPGLGINTPIKRIFEAKDGKIWFVAQDYGLYYYTKNVDKGFFDQPSSGKLYYSLFVNDKNKLFLGTDNGIELFQLSSELDEEKLSKIQNIGPQTEEPIIDIIQSENGLLYSIGQNGTVQRITFNDGVYTVTDILFENLISDIMVKHTVFKNGYLWISTLQEGILKCSIKNSKIQVIEKYNEESGLGSSSVNCSYIDREGVLWIGTFGQGLASKSDNIFTYYFKDKNGENPISAVYINETELYVCGNGVVKHYDKQNVKLIKEYNEAHGLPADEITNIVFDQDSTIYIGTTLNGIFEKRKNDSVFTPIFLSDDNLAKVINSLTLKDNKLLIGTNNGLYRYDIESKGISVFNITVGLPHNSISYVKVASNGKTYVATKSAYISEIYNGEIRNINVMEGFDVVDINMISESENGEIWFSSNGAGIFKFMDTTCLNINSLQGLHSNYCSSLSFDINGNIWITHIEGISKYSLADSTFTIYGESYGLSSRFLRSSASGFDQHLWFGCANGVLRYDAKGEIFNLVPPITSINKVLINNKSVNFKETIRLPYGSYDLAFHNSGLSFKNSEEITFQFILEGSDSKWSNKTKNSKIYYTRIEDGKYVFKVKSFNVDGTEGTLSTVRIIVEKPYWKKWWFYLLILVGLILIYVILIKFQQKRLIRYQKTLEKELKSRTFEVVAQKNKIEEINKDLTDSINYAQRIQSSILPTSAFIEQTFPESFVFFKPRDIVSGDFYWCYETEGLKLMVCGDCTGHGVPGGFMSMMSHIILREAINIESLRNPAKILTQMNEGIKEVLHQTNDINSNRDGLDIGIVVVEKDKLYYAGAMRPLYIYRGGVRTIIKGDRFSIGGAAKNKLFETKELTLELGDLLYLFSDGYADQFGGPRNKKMKLVVLKELLDQVSQLPIKEQHDSIDKFFVEWMGTHIQMDDVLLIGLKIDSLE